MFGGERPLAASSLPGRGASAPASSHTPRVVRVRCTEALISLVVCRPASGKLRSIWGPLLFGTPPPPPPLAHPARWPRAWQQRPPMAPPARRSPLRRGTAAGAAAAAATAALALVALVALGGPRPAHAAAAAQPSPAECAAAGGGEPGTIIDITAPVRAGLPAWERAGGLPRNWIARSLSQDEGDVVNQSHLNLDAHTGTHIVRAPRAHGRGRGRRGGGRRHALRRAQRAAREAPATLRRRAPAARPPRRRAGRARALPARRHDHRGAAAGRARGPRVRHRRRGRHQRHRRVPRGPPAAARRRAAAVPHAELAAAAAGDGALCQRLRGARTRPRPRGWRSTARARGWWASITCLWACWRTLWRRTRRCSDRRARAGGRGRARGEG